MDKLSEIIGQPLNFRLWVDGLGHLQYQDKSDSEQESFNDKTFKGGIQKVILLAVLLFACSYTFWTAKSVSPDDIDKIFSKSFLTTVVSGFAIYMLFNMLVVSYTKKVVAARYRSNILILHFALSLSFMLVGNVLGLAIVADDYVFKATGSARVAAFVWCLACTLPTLLLGICNTSKKNFQNVVWQLLLYGPSTLALLYAYLNQQILGS
jgi:hypothetical protein